MSEESRNEGTEEPQHNPEHLTLLRKGWIEWNKWREENPHIVPNLRYLHLHKGTLGHDDLYLCNLEKANLQGADFRGAKLWGAHLEAAHLFEARLEGVDLAGAHLEGATLVDGQLQKARLCGANLRKANLTNVDLTGADLRGVEGMRLDATIVRDARFWPRDRDPWSVLRRGYTGPKLLFNLLFLVAFLLPYAVKTAGWVMVNRTQDELSLGVKRLESATDQLEAEEHAAAKPIRSVLTAIKERLPMEGNDGWRESRVWRLVLGVDKGVPYWLTAVLLIAYNILRAFLTWCVGPMRDEEERSGHTPRLWRDPFARLRAIRGWRAAVRWWDSWFEAYGWLYRLHRVAAGLLLVAIASFLWHAANWLILPVWIPAT